MSGSITSAVQAVRRVAGFSLLVNVECQNFTEADEAIAAGANIVMLDNMVGEELHDAAGELKRKWKAKGREFLIETSGGIVEDSLASRIGPGKSASATPHFGLAHLSRHRYPLHIGGASGGSQLTVDS